MIIIPFFMVLWYYGYGEIMLRKGLKLLLIVFWMGLIFSFSMDNDLESSRKSESIIIQVSRFVLGDKLTEEKEEFILEKLETPLRKSAHFILYLLLEVWILWIMIEFHSLSKYDYINATLVKRIGNIHDPGIDILSIIAEHEIDIEFPENCISFCLFVKYCGRFLSISFKIFI